MEILRDTYANLHNYSIKIYLLADFQNVESIQVSDDVIKMFQKKLQAKSSDFIWVETLTDLHFFVQTAAAIDPETIDKVRQNGAKILNSCKIEESNEVAIHNISATAELAYVFVEGFVLGAYTFDKYKTEKQTKKVSKLVCIGEFSNSLDELQIVSQAVFAARTMINEPVCALNSVVFAQEIEALFTKTHAHVHIYDKAWIEKEKMGGLLAVNKGSIDPPRFVHIAWNPQNSTEQPVVLVGKGVVFDTGGLSLKTPSSYMETMKADMGGAAAIVGTMKSIVDAQLPLHIHALIPITDNRPSGNAYAPGDVVTMRNGLFVEVLNTDAEGRMILADALSYAETLNPKLVIDVATLTGAANAAVGEHAAVYMGTADKSEMERIEDVSLQVWEPLVKLPLWNMYGDMIKSDIADIKNVGGAFAGAITAGKFLQKFTNYPWIHIDISGSSFLRSKSTYKGIGGTGFGIRLLYSYLKGFVDAKV